MDILRTAGVDEGVLYKRAHPGEAFPIEGPLELRVKAWRPHGTLTGTTFSSATRGSWTAWVPGPDLTPVHPSFWTTARSCPGPSGSSWLPRNRHKPALAGGFQTLATHWTGSHHPACPPTCGFPKGI